MWRTSLIALVLVGCGGPSMPPTPAPPPSAEQAPTNRCLAVAAAKRPKKADEPAKITVKHVLVKHAGAKKAAATVTRTREQACERAEEARAKLEKGAAFAEVVAEYSEEPGAATREGSIGEIERTQVVPPFADAAFELGPNEVSHVVETDFGFHVILRTH